MSSKFVDFGASFVSFYNLASFVLEQFWRLCGILYFLIAAYWPQVVTAVRKRYHFVVTSFTSVRLSSLALLFSFSDCFVVKSSFMSPSCLLFSINSCFSTLFCSTTVSHRIANQCRIFVSHSQPALWFISLSYFFPLCWVRRAKNWWIVFLFLYYFDHHHCWAFLAAL